MAEDENTPETPQGPAVSLVEAPEGESVADIGSAPEAGTEGPSLDDLQAQLDDAEARVKAVEVTLERERAARRHGLADELVPFLRGESAEELATEAATLAKHATNGTGTGLGAGGLDPSREIHSASAIAERLNRGARAW